MRRRLVRLVAVFAASAALVLAPMATTASAVEFKPDGLIWEFD